MRGKTNDCLSLIHIYPDVSLAIAPGSKQVLNMLANNGALAIMIDAGARILESACGPCIGTVSYTHLIYNEVKILQSTNYLFWGKYN